MTSLHCCAIKWQSSASRKLLITSRNLVSKSPRLTFCSLLSVAVKEKNEKVGDLIRDQGLWAALLHYVHYVHITKLMAPPTFGRVVKFYLFPTGPELNTELSVQVYSNQILKLSVKPFLPPARCYGSFMASSFLYANSHAGNHQIRGM